jgi:hypothetical protein
MDPGFLSIIIFSKWVTPHSPGVHMEDLAKGQPSFGAKNPPPSSPLSSRAQPHERAIAGFARATRNLRHKEVVGF